MSAREPIALVVHGHFYQPPRDNPWTDDVPQEPSAAPFHDWNARINAESYRANAYARIYDTKGRIRSMVNNYGRLSFNFGPTLARWIERHDPRTMARVHAGDVEQRQQLGHGGAMAQLWGHAIAPLLTPNDLRTQILWGLSDFRGRFGRDAEGMWLPETAVNPQTLEALIDAGLRFTILAPEQIAAVRAPGDAWSAVDRESIDTGRPYRWLSPRGGGRGIDLAVFDGPMSRAIAFSDAARDAKTFLGHVAKSSERSKVEGRRLVLAASDGELYGHHKKFADLTLAYATSIEAVAHDIEVTNLAAFLDETPATWQAELATGPQGEGTAWSCAHGVGRWRRHCGCAMGPAGDNWSQAWRGPLREALDLLRDRTVELFEDAGADLMVDPWGARDAYGGVIDDEVSVRTELLRGFGRAALEAGHTGSIARAHTLMEMQRAALLMYASCGWFFDDIAGLESALILRQAAQAMDLWRALGARPPVTDVLDILATAHSNEPGGVTGADVFRRVTRDRVTPILAVTHAAFEALSGAHEDPHDHAGFAVTLPERRPLQGQARVVHRRSGVEATVTFAAHHDGGARFECVVDGQTITLDDLDDAGARPLRLAALARLALQPITMTLCRSALALTKALGVLTPAEAEPVRNQLARILLGLLQTHAPTDNGPRHQPQHVPADALFTLALELVELADLGARTEVAHVIEDVVWDAMAPYRHTDQPIPEALKALATRIGITFEEEATSASVAS